MRKKVIIGLVFYCFVMEMICQAGTPKIRFTYVYGRRYVYLKDVAAYYGMKILIAKTGARISSKYSKIVFYFNKRNGYINGVKVHYLFAPFLKKGEPLISENDFMLMVDPVLRYKTLDTHRVRTIMIDPGHGGRDDGTKGKRLKEKDIVLKVSRKLRDSLRRKGYRVTMTRSGDSYLTLKQRTSKCAATRADLYISIHCNSAAPTVSGAETFCLTPAGNPSTYDVKPSYTKEVGHAFNKNNYRLAYEIQKNLIKKTGFKDRGVKHARYYVIKNASCPAALVELGFLSNDREEQSLATAWYQQRIVNAITDAVIKYHRAVKRK